MQVKQKKATIRKICQILVLGCILFLKAESTYCQIKPHIHLGYSWVNGAIGGGILLDNWSATVGYFPTKMPASDEKISSFSASATYCTGLWNESGFYLTAGIASAGYRFEQSYNGGEWTDKTVVPMVIGTVGYKQRIYEGFYIKGGVGYGYCSVATAFTWELMLGLNL